MSVDESTMSPGTEEGAPEVAAARPAPRGGASLVDESRIEAPSRQTMFMLGAVTVSTLVMWAAGRAACNYHVPGESLTPREVSLVEKTVHPKGVALEFAQALATRRFADAEKLAMDDGLAFVKKAAAECAGCAPLDPQKERIWSAPEVLPKANPIAGFVRVTTTFAGASTTRIMLVQRASAERREANDWRVAGVFEAAAELPALPEPPALPPPSLMAPPPATSAAPAASATPTASATPGPLRAVPTAPPQ